MKKVFLGMVLPMLAVGCATTDPYGSGALTAVDYQESRGVKTSVKSLSMSDQSLLRKSRKVYLTSLGDAGWEGSTEYSGRLKVYRWGANAETPICNYAWNSDAGERWHVVREACGGRMASCGRGAAAPIDEFYEVDDVVETLVEPTEPAS